MSLPNYLAAIKSAGIYRFVWDKSEVAGADAEVLRLVVGYSEKGPFNTPVYVKTTAEFKTIYGDINKKLERRGIFFHRMALQALAAGPILCLNLKKFSQEQVDWVGCDPTKAFTENHYKELDQEGQETNKEKDVKTVTGGAAVEKVFNTNRFWNIDPDVLPSQLENKDYITLAATDSVQSSNTIFMRGYKPTGYDVTVLTWYKQQGEDVPSYFEGYEDMMISDFWAEIYVFKGEFTKSIAASEELKRYFNIVDGNVTLKPYVEDAFGAKQDTLSILSSDENSGFVNVYRGCLIPYFKGSNGAYQSLDLLFNADNSTHKMVVKLNADLLYDGDKTPLDITTRGWDKIDAKVLENSINIANGDAIVASIPGIDCLSNKNIFPYSAIAIHDGQNWTYKRSEELVGDPDLYIYSVDGDLEKGVIELKSEYANCGFAEGDRFLFTEDIKGKSVTKVVTLSKYDADKDADKVILTFANENARLMSISTEKTVEGQETKETVTTKYLIKCNDIVTEEIATLAPIYVKGYHYLNTKPASGDMMDKLKWQESILSALIDYEGLRIALTNRKDSEWRYLVDTFESYVDESLKSTLAYIVKLKDNAFGILNFPSINTFISCKYTSFTDSKGKFAMKYVQQGSNKMKPSAKLFSLPMDSEGASFVGFFTPVIFSDGTVKTACPSAALVSNVFMEKYNSRHAYDIVAGPNYSRIIYNGLVGPDYNFSRDDLDILEPMGVNAIVYVPRQGTYINSNQTAKQNPVTALSKINVRELVIFIQDEIEKILGDYQWEFNNATLRSRIKEKADSVLENIKANGGINAYVNTVDDSNNTPEIIDNEMLIIDTQIEPGKGAGKMVQQLTLRKNGDLSSSVNA